MLNKRSKLADLQKQLQAMNISNAGKRFGLLREGEGPVPFKILFFIYKTIYCEQRG